MKDIERLASTLKAVAATRDSLTKLLVDEGWEDESEHGPAAQDDTPKMVAAFRTVSPVIDYTWLQNLRNSLISEWSGPGSFTTAGQRIALDRALDLVRDVIDAQMSACRTNAATAPTHNILADLKRAYKALSDALDGDGPTCQAVHVQHAWEIVGLLVDELSKDSQP